MTNEILGALKLSGGNEVKINYESLKNFMGFEDIFYDDYLMPTLTEHNLEHRFSGEYIILKQKTESDINGND